MCDGLEDAFGIQISTVYNAKDVGGRPFGMTYCKDLGESMAPLTMHLVVGERVYPRIPQLAPVRPAYGAFLLGCMLVDAHMVTDLGRQETHFVGRLEEDGENAFRGSCAGFLSQFDELLLRPWRDLSRDEKAFVAGYLCHLATDESWKEYNWHLLRGLGLSTLSELPVPNQVFLTAYQVLSAQVFVDHAGVLSALRRAAIPDVLAHLSRAELDKMWWTIRPLALDGSAPESFFQMMERAGEPRVAVRALREEHDLYWNDALSFICAHGGVKLEIQNAVERSVGAVVELWAKQSV